MCEGNGVDEVRGFTRWCTRVQLGGGNRAACAARRERSVKSMQRQVNARSVMREGDGGAERTLTAACADTHHQWQWEVRGAHRPSQPNTPHTHRSPAPSHPLHAPKPGRQPPLPCFLAALRSASPLPPSTGNPKPA
jgi:hypothetical protein